MEEKENVYGENTQTEEAAKADAGEKDLNAPTGASAELGKFKDVSALLKAYGSLQAEFTRRSQRLKELERQAEQREDSGAEASQSDARKGAEKLRKSAELRRGEEKRFDEFVREIERADGETPRSESSAFSVREDSTGTATGEQEASVRAEKSAKAEEERSEPSVADGPNATLSSEELFALVSRDENARLRVIGEYLASVGRSGAPLTRGGAGVCVSPAARAKNIGEAGNMALRFFQKENR